MNTPRSTLVYSTGQGRVPPHQASGHQPIPPQRPGMPNDGVVRVGRETAGRKGKGVTVISGLPREKQEEMTRYLKQKCGAGGTIRDHVIEIQGDHRGVIIDALTKQGYTVKRSGG